MLDWGVGGDGANVGGGGAGTVARNACIDLDVFVPPSCCCPLGMPRANRESLGVSCRVTMRPLRSAALVVLSPSGLILLCHPSALVFVSWIWGITASGVVSPVSVTVSSPVLRTVI